MNPHRLPIAILALSSLALLAGPAQSSAPRPSGASNALARAEAEASLAHLEVELSSLPVEIHRRAVSFLELERERPGSKWVGARLADRVLPMMRPGDPAPTYYEIRVLDERGDPVGYFVLSTGEHDHPVPIAVEEGVPRSNELALGIEPGQSAARVHFLSAVSWVAEGAHGQSLAQLGGLPPKILDADESLLSLSDEARASRSSWIPTGGGEGRLVHKAPERAIELGTWSSWDELRREYVSNYAVPHEIMRRNAADDWDLLREGSALAEGLQPGWFREVPLLSRGGAKLTIEGAGSRFVRVERLERPLEGDDAFAVFVDEVEGDQVHPLDVRVDYGDGSSEVHHFAIARRVPTTFADAPGSTVPDAELAALAELAARPSAHLAAPTATAVAMPECNKVVLRSAYETYVFARDGGGSTLEARGGWIGGWEIFRLDKAGSGVYALRAPNGKYVKAEWGGGGAVKVDGGGIEAYTKFRRKAFDDGTVELRANHKDMPLRVFGDGAVNANASGGNTRLRLEYCAPERLSAHWAGANDPIGAMRNVRKYDQLQGSQAPNRAPCASGCGATVWAMVFGWADHMAAKNHPKWGHYKGLYRKDGAKTGPDEDAPEFMWSNMPARVLGSRADADLVAGVGKITEEIRTYLDDWGAAGCTVTGSRFTVPHIMAQARQYVTTRGIDIGLTADYDGAGIMTHAGKMNALGQIKDHDRVVAIGIGYFSHYPLAYGYEHARFAAWDAGNKRWATRTEHHRFVVNMGWAQYGSANVPFDSWFAGYLTPTVVHQAANTVNVAVPAVTPKPATTKAGPSINPKTAKPQSKLPGPAPTPIFPKK